MCFITSLIIRLAALCFYHTHGSLYFSENSWSVKLCFANVHTQLCEFCIILRVNTLRALTVQVFLPLAWLSYAEQLKQLLLIRCAISPRWSVPPYCTYIFTYNCKLFVLIIQMECVVLCPWLKWQELHDFHLAEIRQFSKTWTLGMVLGWSIQIQLLLKSLL